MKCQSFEFEFSEWHEAKTICYSGQSPFIKVMQGSNSMKHSPNVSTTPITAMGCRQCLPLSVVQLKGKHCRKPHCSNGVVDTFGQGRALLFLIESVTKFDDRF